MKVLLFATLACATAKENVNVAVAWRAPPPPPPVGTIGNGTCGATKYGGDCNTDPTGAWDARKEGILNLTACVAKARGCKMANFVSFSLKDWNSDCSWYSACDMGHLCEDCSSCLGCPSYVPYSSEVIKAVPPQEPKVTLTAATVEVDVMPFLGRTHEGGKFDSYYAALSELGSEFVRFSPWFPYPRVAVTELTPPDCTASRPATNWNSTLFDGVVRDFMSAVCGPRAPLNASCTHSVAQQLSTMPAWLYKGQYPRDVPADPWEYGSNAFKAYSWDSAELVNESCVDMASYVGRVVEHYTRGGHHDSCGHWHGGGFHYNWTVLSVLNENEHNIGGERYTRCFDAIRKVVEAINGDIALAGPETVFWPGSLNYVPYFVDPANHADKRPPAIVSNHFAEMDVIGAGEAHFAKVDQLMGTVAHLAALRDQLAPQTELVMNEWIPFNTEWCNTSDAARLFAAHAADGAAHPLTRDPRSRQSPRARNGCPNWQDARSKGTRINRKTIGWNAAAAMFAYGYGRFAALGYRYFGADQLVGGPWPDNEPAVSSIDWDTGEVNAKYWAVRMLAKALGAGPKTIYDANVTSGPPPPPPVGTIGNGTCGATKYGGDCNTDPTGAWDARKEGILNLTACVAKARGCKMANFVSFSLKDWNSDCSWYSACDMGHLCEDCSTCGIGCPSYVPYSSEVIKVAPPSPPPRTQTSLRCLLSSTMTQRARRRHGRREAGTRTTVPAPEAARVQCSSSRSRRRRRVSSERRRCHQHGGDGPRRLG